MASRTLDIEQKLQSELSTLTTAQGELDQAMATVTPIQARVEGSQAKVEALMTELQSLLKGPPSSSPEQTSSQPLSAEPAAKKSPPRPGARKKTPAKAKFGTRTFTVEGRIKLARAAAEMQAKRKGLSSRLVKKAGDAMETKKRAELGG